MVEPQDPRQPLAPSRKAIAKATGIALFVALVILFTAVLPAEYGIDPLKTGALLHLTDLAKATAAKPETKSEAKPVIGARPTAARRAFTLLNRIPTKWIARTFLSRRAKAWRSNTTCARVPE